MARKFQFRIRDLLWLIAKYGLVLAVFSYGKGSKRNIEIALEQLGLNRNLPQGLSDLLFVSGSLVAVIYIGHIGVQCYVAFIEGLYSDSGNLEQVSHDTSKE